MHQKIKTMPLFAAMAVGLTGMLVGNSHAQDPFGQVTQRLTPLEPLEQPPPPPTPSPTVPPPAARTPINQRIEQIQDDAFTILPENMPLPNSTISREILLGEKSQPAPVVPRNDQQSGRKLEKMELLARVMQGENGAPVLRLAGLSPGRQATWHSIAKSPVTSAKQVATEVQSKPEKPPQVPRKPAMMKKSFEFSYSLDEITPDNLEPLTKLKEQLATAPAAPTYIRVAVAVLAPPLVESIRPLGLQRWAWLKAELAKSPVNLPPATIVIVAPADGKSQHLAVDMAFVHP